ncbi:PH domain-containing protein [Paenibacillus tarimensis]|uniref:PH domain-containing protein n=1 Tax=Paenibacillus tarimensis TaxID=416012 RepID=UPI001F3027E6|nr:PH domain-containing protein [Paenibacillus tarimensis]MCF2942693.1 PH domain-containing protein [Paenibacillus tarimensis]
MVLQDPQQRIDEDALKAWRLGGWISAAVYAVIIGIMVFLTIRFDWPYWIAGTALLIAVLVALFEIAYIPVWRWRRFRYDVSEHEIDLLHGLFIRKRTIIPMVKIQHVDTKQGPLLRKYQLATVTFSTAAGSHEIPALLESKAEQVRNQIAQLARITDEEI